MWLASGRRNRGTFHLERVLPAAALASGDRSDAAAHAAVLTLVKQCPDAAFGIDAPLGLPVEVTGAGSWARRVRDFLESARTAEELKSRCGERRRLTDREARAPMAPGNLRLYRQTWSVLARLALPAVLSGHARVVPAQSPLRGRAWLLEVCPAVVLGHWGLRRPYKGGGPQRRDARRALLDAMVEGRSLAPPPRATRELLIEHRGGDPLDAVIIAAALSVWLAAGNMPRYPGAREHGEGWLLVPPPLMTRPRSRRGAGPRACMAQRVRR